jgi:hypothetical protein
MATTWAASMARDPELLTVPLAGGFRARWATMGLWCVLLAGHSVTSDARAAPGATVSICHRRGLLSRF